MHDVVVNKSHVRIFHFLIRVFFVIEGEPVKIMDIYWFEWTFICTVVTSVLHRNLVIRLFLTYEPRSGNAEDLVEQRQAQRTRKIMQCTGY